MLRNFSKNVPVSNFMKSRPAFLEFLVQRDDQTDKRCVFANFGWYLKIPARYVRLSSARNDGQDIDYQSLDSILNEHNDNVKFRRTGTNTKLNPITVLRTCMSEPRKDISHLLPQHSDNC